MADTAGIVKGMRQALQDVLTPEIRELRAEVASNSRRLDDLREDFRSFTNAIDRRLDLHDDVQRLRERMARLEGQREHPPSA